MTRDDRVEWLEATLTRLNCHSRWRDGYHDPKMQVSGRATIEASVLVIFRRN